MRIALMIEGQEGVSWNDWLALAAACEEHGVEALLRSDHYLSQTDPVLNQALDAWTTLAGLAARTTRLRLGTLVSPVTFRHPSVLANAVATVDQISGGRAELGIGAGWMTEEHEAFGFPFPETAERVRLFAEQLEIVHRLWTEKSVDFTGTNYQLEGAPGLPRPVQRPHPPIVVGGSGQRGTAVPAARFADEYNPPFATVRQFAEIRGRVRRTCEAEGRDPDTMRFSLMTGCVIGADRDEALDRARRLHATSPREGDFESWLSGYSEAALVGSVDEVAARLRELEEVGCERVMLQHLLHNELDSVALIGRELAPEVA
ncbi:MAG: LLM class F420-dependent oxidoreductase [Gaiellaceae bacterium]